MPNSKNRNSNNSYMESIDLGTDSPIRLLLDSCQTGLIIAFMDDFIVKYFNKKVLDYFKISKEYADKTSLPVILDNLNGISQNGTPLRKENYPIWLSLYGKNENSLVFHKSKSGIISTLTMKSSFVQLNEKTKGVIATVDDITETMNLQEKLQDATLRLENLWRVSSNENITIKEVCDITLEAIVNITRSKYGFYGFISENEKEMTIHAWSGEAMKGCSVVNKPFVYSIEHSGIWAEAVRQRKHFIINDYASCNQFKKGYPSGHVELKNLMIIPHFIGNKMHSVVAVANKFFDYNDTDTEIVVNFLNDIYSVIKRLELEKELKLGQEQDKKLASTDPLTGLYNRRYFFDYLSLEISRIERSCSNISIILLDLDYFKKINDTYGHSAGDIVLKEVASCLLSSLRTTDISCRFGGEEFIVALPDTKLADAVVVAEKIRLNLKKNPIFYKDSPINITASFGVSSHEGHNSKNAITSTDIDVLINQADNALYTAKQAGRNRVFTVHGPFIQSNKFE